MNTVPRLVTGVFALSVVLLVAFYAVALYVHCPSWATKIPYCPKLDSFWAFFNGNIRASLFAGFLSLGGFLLSLKTFIIVNMKKDVFDTQKYKEIWNQQKKLGESRKVGRRLDPLEELSNVLFAAIVSCITTAVLQITVGLIDSFLTAILCLWSAAFSTMLLLTCLLLIKSNLKSLFDHQDE